MKRALKWIALAFLLAALGGGFFVWRLLHPSLSYISRFAPLSFPEGTTLVSSGDDGETFLRAVIRFASAAQVSEFLTANALEAAKPTQGERYYVCRGKHSLDISLDRQKNEARLEIGYPDYSGDSPCR